MSEVEKLRECGDVLAELSHRIDADSADLEASSSMLQQVVNLVEPILAGTSAISDDRRDLLTQGLLSANLHMTKCVQAVLKARIELAALLLAPEFRGD